MTPPTERDAGMGGTGRRDGSDGMDVLEARLRRALTAEADMVHPSGDGLSRIRAGIDRQRYDVWWRRPAVALAAAAVLGLAVGGGAVALTRGGEDPTGPVAVQPTDEPPTSAPTGESPSPTSSVTESDDPAPTGEGTAPAPGGGRVEVPVYYVHDDGQAIRLYREFHRVQQHAQGRIATAVTEMFRAADDPDYSSSWPSSTTVRSVSRTGDTATVDLSDFPSVGGDAEDKAVQQLVYTVTAAENSVKRVRVLVDGDTPPSGHADWSQPVARAPMLDVQGLVWILQPRQDAAVGSPVRLTVYGTAYEGNVILKVFHGETEVTTTFVTTAMGEFREASTTVELEPGRYTVVAYDGNGENGELTERDSKAFTVE